MKLFIATALFFIINVSKANEFDSNYNLPFPTFPKIDNEPTGTIWSIEFVDHELLIGAENGFFKIVGTYQTKFLHCETGKDVVSVTDILDFDENFVFVNSYGYGVFKLDKVRGCFNGPLELNIEDSESSWLIGRNTDYFFVSTIQNFYILNAKTLELEFSLKELIGARRDIGINSFVSTRDNVFLGVGSDGLLKINLDDFSVKTFSIEESFKDSSEVSSLGKIDNGVIVGTDAGLFFSQSDGVFNKVQNSESLGTVTKILVENRSVMLIADGIFQLVPNRDSFFEIAATVNLTRRVNGSLYTDLEVDEYGNLYTSTGKTGLIYIPIRSGSLKYMFFLNSNFKYGKNFSVGSINKEEFVFSEGIHGTLAYSLEKHSVSDTKNYRLTASQNSKIQYDENSNVILKVVGTDKVPIFEGDIVEYYKREQFHYFTVRQAGLFSVDQDGIISLLSRNAIILQSPINCVVEKRDTLILCSSGSGLLLFDKNTNEISRLEWFLPNFVRGAATLHGEIIAVATNNGLYLVNLEKKTMVLLAQDAGVFDFDFEYDSVKSYDTKTIIFGDKLGYLFENEYLINQFSASSTSQVKLQAIAVLDPETKKIESATHRLRHDQDRTSLFVLDSDEDLLTFEFAVSGNIDSDRKHFSYRLLGFNSNWEASHSASEAISYSNLKHGEYYLEARSEDVRMNVEQPVFRLKVVVLPPFYMTNEAFIVYSILIVLIISIALYMYWRNVLEAKEYGETTAKNKILALKDNSESLHRLIAHKQLLITNISHEIRTPLTLVTEPLKVIASKLNDDEAKKQFDIVSRNADRVTCLVEQLLEVERLSCIKETPSHSYDVGNTTTYVVESLKPMAEQKNQQLILKNNAKGSITLYQDTLQQILYNLISNAVKYSPEDSEIVIKAWEQNSFVMLSVRDQGPGLAPNEARMMFGKFARLENSDKEKGIGIGLSLVKQLVKANSGFIEVTSEPQKGAEFKVILPTVLPLAKSNGDKPEGNSNSDSEKEENVFIFEAKPTRTNEQPVLLIAEDSDELREFLHDLFKDEFNCYLVKNGKEAINAVSQLMPDLVVTDYKMPIKSGVELAEFVRSEKMLSHIPVFMLTGMNDKDSIKAGHEALVDEYILKPFNRDILLQKVKNRLAINQKMRESVSHLLANSNEGGFFDAIPKLAKEKDQRFYLGLRTCFEKHACDPEFNRSKCAAYLHVCERQLNRKLEVVAGKNFTETIKAYRVFMAKKKLLAGYSVTDAAYECGFSNPSYFSTVFKAQTNLTPSAFAEQKGVMIES